MRKVAMPTVPEDREIPAVVHQIWVGSPPPPWVRTNWAIWDDFADRTGLTMNRLTEADVERSLTGRLGLKLSPVQFADFWRIETVYLRGGIYMDCDTIPLSPLGEWVGARPAWLGQGQPWGDGTQLSYNNATFGFQRGHPFMAAMWGYGIEALARGLKNPFDVAGPNAYRRVYLSREDRWGVELPHGPFQSYSDKDKRAEIRMGRQFTMDELRGRYPEAVVVHTSAATWQTERPSKVTRAHQAGLDWGTDDEG